MTKTKNTLTPAQTEMLEALDDRLYNVYQAFVAFEQVLKTDPQTEDNYDLHTEIHAQVRRLARASDSIGLTLEGRSAE